MEGLLPSTRPPPPPTHPPSSSAPPSRWQKYINQDTLASNFLPQQLLSPNTLLSYRTENIYDKWSQQTRALVYIPIQTLCVCSRKSKYKSVPGLRPGSIVCFKYLQVSISEHKSCSSGGGGKNSQFTDLLQSQISAWLAKWLAYHLHILRLGPGRNPSRAESRSTYVVNQHFVAFSGRWPPRQRRFIHLWAVWEGSKS